MSSILERGPGGDGGAVRRRGFSVFGRWESPARFVAISALVALGAALAVLVIRADSAHHGTISPTGRSSLAVGTRAPAFTLPALSGRRAVSLPSAREPVVVNFFNSTTRASRKELRALVSVAKSTRGTVAVIGVDTEDPHTTRTAALLSADGVRFPVGADPNGHVAATYDLTGVPVTYFLRANHTVAHVSFGVQGSASLRYWLRRAEGSGASRR